MRLPATWILCLSTLPPDSGTLISKWNAKFTFISKEDFGPLSNSPALFLLSPGNTLVTLSLVQEWLDTRNVTVVAHVLDTSVRGGSSCTESSLRPLLVNLPQILERPLLHNALKAAVIPVACAPLSTTLFPSTQLSMNIFGYSTLWTASVFSNDLLWLTLLVEGVSDCVLDNCNVISLPHDCVAYWTKLRDRLKAQETFAGVFS